MKRMINVHGPPSNPNITNSVPNLKQAFDPKKSIPIYQDEMYG